MSNTEMNPIVGIVMGSDSDWEVMKSAAQVCEKFEVAFESRVVSAHRTPDDMAEYGKAAAGRGIKVIIAGAGGAAHLPGMLASHTTLPVIGVPVETRHLKGIDSLLSIVQMPKGIPVATVAISNGENAGLLAIRILAAFTPDLQNKLKNYHTDMAVASRLKTKNLI